MKAESVFDVIQALPGNEYIRLLKMIEEESKRKDKTELKVKELSYREQRINYYKEKLGII